MLAEFWKGHDASSGGGPRQYRNVVLFSSESQRAAAEASRDAESVRLGRKARTAIEPLQCFWPAEEYHQKYYLQGDKDLSVAFKAGFAGSDRWYLSTSAARFNALASGATDAAALSRELGRFALPEALKTRLNAALARR